MVLDRDVRSGGLDLETVVLWLAHGGEICIIVRVSLLLTMWPRLSLHC